MSRIVTSFMAFINYSEVCASTNIDSSFSKNCKNIFVKTSL